MFSRKAVAEAKLSTRNPCERSKRSVERRTEASSSTTKTVGAFSLMLLRAVERDGQRVLGISCPTNLRRRQCEREGRAGSRVRFRPHPAAVGLDDRAPDRKPHPHSVCLRCVEGLEEPVFVRIPQTHAAI